MEVVEVWNDSYQKVGRKKTLKFNLMEELDSPIDYGSADNLPYFILYPDLHYNLNKDLETQGTIIVKD